MTTRLGLASALILSTLSLPGCNWVQDRFRECGHVTVEMTNDRQNRFAAHIAAEEEDWSSETLLQPGQSRRIAVCVERGDRKRFRSMQDGAVNHVVNCVSTLARYELEFTTSRVVLYPNQLACENW